MKQIFSFALISLLLNLLHASPIASIWGNLPDSAAQSMKRSIYGLYHHLPGYAYNEQPEPEIYVLPPAYRSWTN
ncbi:Uncharacterized protein BM_BM18074 [Brugia malayi]|uniref:Uncharacterized protein n=1 Tax=Brugia malayi TaxID=6279 RepID=A0A4E9F7A3_BRUMA|nr:Uncharacterized protein BM_BM18074 [Brugia malayi]VIO89851.1 Uncharacterized protein BM_BM18074 [Brugia malayi]